MYKLREVIRQSLKNYPEFEEFLIALELAQDDEQSPGTRVDAAKSVYEAIIKNMLRYLDNSKSHSLLERLSLPDAMRLLLEEFMLRDEEINADFVEHMTNVIRQFSITRNKTGDISHGHVVPKQHSTKHATELILQYVESTCIYLFEIFNHIDFSYERPQPYDDEESREFNRYLDENKEPIGNVLYSRALYELDYDAYIDNQDRYNSGLL